MVNLYRRWMALWHPNRYHGWDRTKNYFEGWYYKMVSADESLALALIPGISMDDEGNQHSFIQMIDGTEGKTYYERFELDQFEAKEDQFEVSIGENSFSEQFIDLNLPQIQGRLHIGALTPWPSEFGAPGIMGWYSFVPFMQCYHGLVSMYHQLSGAVTYNGQEVSFENGLGYIEKDWGTSFPKSWIWAQCSHFDDLSRKVSVMASVAHIPWMGRYFIGHLVTFALDDQLVKFTTYNRSIYSASLNEESVHLTFTRKALKLVIDIDKGHTGSLISPIRGEMAGKVNESLAAKFKLSFYRNEQLIYEGLGRHGGLEVAGEVDILLSSK